MEEIIRFVSLLKTDRFTVTELCEQFGVSRKTGYKHLARYEAEGLKGLRERSHRTAGCPHRTDEGIEQLIIHERGLHTTWGPKKLRTILQRKHAVEAPPSESTIGAILARRGLSVPRRRKPGAYAALNHELTVPTQVNHVWTVDFKGWFNLNNGLSCNPLTVCDRFSHYILCCRAQPNQQYKQTKRTFVDLMRYYGLPQVIRVDHGVPFASYGLGRFSQLSIWWVEQGIEVEFTRIAHPQDNGSHERMHKDLKAEATIPASDNLATQQKRFDRWRYDYNHCRPHEALDQRTPADVYARSHRRMNANQRKIVYPKGYVVKRVSVSGHLSHEGRTYLVGEVFAEKRVALHLNAAGQTELHYANVLLGTLAFDAEGRFRPTAYIAPPPLIPLAKPKSKRRTKV